MTGLQFLYAVINFLILFGVLYFLTKKTVGKMLCSRKDRIAAELEQAQESRKQTEYLADNIDRATLENMERQSEIIKNARELAKENSSSALELSRKEADRIIENASKGEQLLREEMQEKISAETVKKAVNLARDILKQDAFAASRQTLTDVFLDRIKYRMKVMPSDVLSLSGLKKHDISVVSTQPLSSKQMETLAQSLGEVFISCRKKVDRSVTGVQLKVGNAVYCGTLDDVLNRLGHDVEDNTYPKLRSKAADHGGQSPAEQVRKVAVELGER